MATKTDSNRPRVLSLALPTLAITGGVSALGYLRSRLQRSRVFLPDRYPDGIWDRTPSVYKSRIYGSIRPTG